jgi:SAM-dependent methyltransferase
VQDETVTPSPALHPREQLRNLIHGYIWTQVLRIAARLRLADLLAGGPLTLEELAARVEANPDILRRIMSGLATIGIVVAERDGRYRLTPLGEELREGAPGSLAELAILSGEEYYRAWLGLDPAASDDVTPFERALGAPLFTWLSQNPETGDRFNHRMAGRVAAYAPAAAAAVDLSNVRTIVDVGGGLGGLLEAFLRRWPDARGILFDLPAAAESGKERLAAVGLGDQVDSVGGDFFQEVTPGGDAYLLSQILHDWDDDQSRSILGNIRRAIAPDGRLLIVELLLPEHVAGPHPAVDLDLIMLVVTGGQERTVAQYRELLQSAEFALERVHREIAPGGMALLEARPV